MKIRDFVTELQGTRTWFDEEEFEGFKDFKNLTEFLEKCGDENVDDHFIFLDGEYPLFTPTMENVYKIEEKDYDYTIEFFAYKKDPDMLIVQESGNHYHALSLDEAKSEYELPQDVFQTIQEKVNAWVADNDNDMEYSCK